MKDGWVKGKDDWQQDGCGYYVCDGREFRVVVQDLVSTSHRVAFLNGVEVARARKFTAMVRKLEKWCKQNPSPSKT